MKILSIEKYLPSTCVSSDELDKTLGLPSGYIEKLTGVKTRYRASEQEKSISDLGANALKLALKKANLQASDLDLLISTGASMDYPIPNNATLIKSKITDDSNTFPCFDVDSTCLSFLNGLDIAHLYLHTGRYHRIAIVCSEIATQGLSPEDVKVFGLFGDAAVAMIIENTVGYVPTYSHFVNYPSGAMFANLPVGGAMNRGRHENSDSTAYDFKMDGRKLIRLTTECMDLFVKELEDTTKNTLNDFDALIMHQTSRYGNEYVLKKYGLDESKFINTLTGYGNCISASVPLGLEQYFNACEGKLQNQKLLLLGAAAGVSLGCLVLEF